MTRNLVPKGFPMWKLAASIACMGTNKQPDDPSANEARTAINSASEARDRVVAHARAPWWYFALCGVLCGVIAAAQILPPDISYFAIIVFCLGVVAVGGLYKSLTGITIKIFARSGLPYTISAIAVVYLGIFVSSMAAHSWNSVLVAILASLAVAVAITAGGLRWQRQVASPSPTTFGTT
ncbi:hypothetical protein [Cryobacterium sp. N19]|uniref:hypothetical protein n=1 Tax=Cryobacterium sp. N19 TaxID=2048288 RepID=UPI001125168E|nr:hypothetical protein [Cryobacterium sp. N19]